MLLDLRSDTVTRPTAAMRQAMANADVGDDVYGEDPTVNALEALVADMFGHEAALFTPSGSMANQIALQLLVAPGDELLLDSEAHVVSHEVGAAAAIGGISTRTWPSPPRGRVAADLVSDYVRPAAGFHTVATRAIAVENTHNRGGGTVQALDELRGLRELTGAAGLGLHCDGARIWNASVASGVSFAEYGALFDTMSVCLSKGLGAPVGSLVIASRDRIARAKVLRKRMGGGMRQAGILAAAGVHALDQHLARLADDHERAAALAAALEPYGVTDASTVETNIVLLRVPRIAELAAAAAEQGVFISVMGPTSGRLLTHLDVDDAKLKHAIAVLTGSLESHGL
ncbi:threonine aldolase family protein [Stackebrandtia soli]|uniref:threonine aldolase family protein n=1 Tax=Stackebrandtia soli TaxID=1892856 RepID=UPI0039EA3A7F